MKKFNVAKLALIGAAAIMMLQVIGCGSSGDSDAGQNVNPTKPPGKAKAGGKHNSAQFISIE